MTTNDNNSTVEIKLLSVAEAAKRLTISRRQYYKLLQRGEVPVPANIFGVKRVPMHEVDAIIAAKLAARK